MMDDAICARQEAGVVAKAMLLLSPRYERALRMRYGIGCDEGSLDEVGQSLNVTRERARQIILKGERLLFWKVRKLRPELFSAAMERQRGVRKKLLAEETERQAQWEEQDRQWEKRKFDEQTRLNALLLAEARERRERNEQDRRVRAEEQERARAEVIATRWARIHRETEAERYETEMGEANARFRRAREAYVSHLGEAYEEIYYREYVAAIYWHQVAYKKYLRSYDGRRYE